MKFAASVAASAAAAAAVLAFSASPAAPSDAKTWYVYCEGTRQGDHWAVFSENFWPHPLTEGYGRRAGTAAKAFFESRHDLRLDGCAAVNFIDASLAEHSRNRTAQLHRKMGDQVLYFALPSEALPVDPPAVPTVVTLEVRRASEPQPAAADEQPTGTRGPMTPGGSDR